MKAGIEGCEAGIACWEIYLFYLKVMWSISEYLCWFDKTYCKGRDSGCHDVKLSRRRLALHCCILTPQYITMLVMSKMKLIFFGVIWGQCWQCMPKFLRVSFWSGPYGMGASDNVTLFFKFTYDIIFIYADIDLEKRQGNRKTIQKNRRKKIKKFLQ